MDSVSGVGVLDKSVAVLAALSEHGPLSLADLVAATGLSRPTAHRLAVALETHGMVGRDDSGRFRLGLRLLAWGTRANEASGMVELARPVLEALRDRTGESTQLYVREDGNRVCVASAERPSGLRDTVPVGAVLPIERGSGGKVLLAWGDAPADPSTRAELAAIRAQGWASSVGEREPGVASVSAPVLDGSGHLLGAISVSGPLDRFGSEPGRRFAEAVVAAAKDLERRAGLS
ncbi:MAG: transcriptional regulator, IclR family [Actinomycetia bacterium]|nr:transcriptional regulator, IclR family [Actinomycetes bacterium]